MQASLTHAGRGCNRLAQHRQDRAAGNPASRSQQTIRGRRQASPTHAGRRLPAD